MCILEDARSLYYIGTILTQCYWHSAENVLTLVAGISKLDLMGVTTKIKERRETVNNTP